MLEQLRPMQNDHTLLSPRIPRDTEHERYHPELEEELKANKEEIATLQADVEKTRQEKSELEARMAEEKSGMEELEELKK